MSPNTATAPGEQCQAGSTFASKSQLQRAWFSLPQNAAHPQHAGQVKEPLVGPFVHSALERHKISKNQAPSICPFLSSGCQTRARPCPWHRSGRTGDTWQSLVLLREYVWDSSILCQQCLILLPCLWPRTPHCGPASRGLYKLRLLSN